MKRQKKKRRCLRCQRLFVSEGRFNRVCSKCSELNLGMSVRESAFVRLKAPAGSVADKVGWRD